MSKLFQIIYFSKASRLMSKQDLIDILQTARQKNMAYGITGMLLYKDQSFLQVLEGEEPLIRQVFSSIEKDDRHCRVTIILESEIKVRTFSSWWMGFQNIENMSPEQVEGYSEFMNSNCDLSQYIESPARAVKFLLYFRAVS